MASPETAKSTAFKLPSTVTLLAKMASPETAKSTAFKLPSTVTLLAKMASPETANSTAFKLPSTVTFFKLEIPVTAKSTAFKLPSTVTFFNLEIPVTAKSTAFKLPSIVVSCNNVSSLTVSFSFIKTSFNSDNPDTCNLPSKDIFPSTSNFPSTFTLPSTSNFPSITVSCNNIVSSSGAHFLEYSILFIAVVVTFLPCAFELHPQCVFVFVSFLQSFGIFIYITINFLFIIIKIHKTITRYSLKY